MSTTDDHPPAPAQRDRTTAQGTDHWVEDESEGVLIRHHRLRGHGLRPQHEARLLALLAPRIPVPTVMAVLPDGGLRMTRVPGGPLLDRLSELTSTDRTRIADELGAWLSTLQAVPRDEVEALIPVRLPDRHAELTEAREWAIEHTTRIAHLNGLEDFLAAVPPAAGGPVLLTHGDLGAEHVFVLDTPPQIQGVIDWSDAVLGDPAVDYGLILRDLGPQALATALRHYPVDTDPGVADRARFHAVVKALEDLDHGLGTGDERYTLNAQRALGVLFGCHTT